MISNINSSYFIKLIYTFVDEGQKLKIIKCNKNMQKLLDISITNYKYFKGNYIIYEENGFAKEYRGGLDDLIFEGTYLNGKRHGKGKEYYSNDQIKFEGEYINGKRNGKGKEYYSNDQIKFEGEYLNNKEWIGTRYDYDGKIMYKLNNNINGKEYDDYSGKLIFEGEYLNGKRHGKGKEYYDSGELRFEGEYRNDLRWNGKGYDQLNNIIYELKSGKGLIKEYYGIDELKFEGEYINGKRNGKGKEYHYDNGNLEFEGEYLNDKKNGKGKK